MNNSIFSTAVKKHGDQWRVGAAANLYDLGADTLAKSVLLSSEKVSSDFSDYLLMRDSIKFRRGTHYLSVSPFALPKLPK